MFALYICNWCHEGLKPSPMAWWEWLLGMGLVRAYYCPHCQARYYRPPAGLLRRSAGHDTCRHDDAADCSH